MMMIKINEENNFYIFKKYNSLNKYILFILIFWTIFFRKRKSCLRSSKSRTIEVDIALVKAIFHVFFVNENPAFGPLKAEQLR